MNYLQEHNICFTPRDIKLANPSEDELREWIQKSGLPIQKFFNSSGLLYKELNLKSRLPELSFEEKIQLLATNGMLVKRPILIGEDTILVGFKAEEYEALL